MKKPSLLVKIFIAIVLGIVTSLFFPLWLDRVFMTFNSIFGNFLGMFIPLLIIGLVAPGISNLGKGAGKLLGITILIAGLSTICSGFFSYFTCRWSYPIMLGDSMKDFGSIPLDNVIAPYFTIEMPPFISVTTALVCAFILGLGCSVIQGETLKNALSDFGDLITKVIESVIIPFLPVYIYGIFLQIGAEGKIAPLLGMFAKIIVIIFVMHITVLLAQFIIAGIVSGKNPFKALWNMLPAYATALGTQSSAATIPVTLRQVTRNGVSDDVASFVVPLCATIHMSCSELKIVACAMAVSLSFGLPADFATYSGFILMLAITTIAAPGVPGGCIMAALGLLSSMLGINAEMQGVIIALYMVMDSFGTAGNVTGDGAIALIINKIRSK